jgi:hypothetical protein
MRGAEQPDRLRPRLPLQPIRRLRQAEQPALRPRRSRRPETSPKTRIVAFPGAEPVAVTLDALTARSVITLHIAGQDVVAWALPGLRSALDMPDLEAGRTIAATGAFDPHWHGRLLHFAARGPQFIDAETGSRWTVLGRAVAGPARGGSTTTHPLPGYLLVRLGGIPATHPHRSLSTSLLCLPEAAVIRRERGHPFDLDAAPERDVVLDPPRE